jgi:hypothetical protein
MVYLVLRQDFTVVVAAAVDRLLMALETLALEAQVEMVLLLL